METRKNNVGYARSTKRQPKKKKAYKGKVTSEQLRAVIHAVFSEADEDGNGDLDINECRTFCQKLQGITYPAETWDEDKYKLGFYAIDVDKGGSIDFEELYEIIYNNAKRQGMIAEG